MSSCVKSPTLLKKNNKCEEEEDDDDKNVRIDTPNPNDVLCGRGGNINSHRGNEQFRGFVEKRKRVYLTARFKREKRLIASSIVNEIRAMDPPGRFLARMGSMKDNNVYWHDIGNEKARDKTSQALRENAPSIRAEIETEINQQRAEMRRQETGEKPQQQQLPSTILSSGGVGVGLTKDGPCHPSGVPGISISTSSSMFPPPPLGHHPGHHPGHGQSPLPHPAHPPPPPPHLYNPHHSHYAQQYYDYYYHYYGYGAPPPPPPPGYQNSSESTKISAVQVPNGASPAAVPLPAGPQGYPPAPAPPPYWAAQSSNASGGNPALGHSPPATAPTNASSPPYSSSGHPSDGNTAHTTSNGKSVATLSEQGIVGKPTATATATETISMNNNVQYPPYSSCPPIHNQEEEDRRMAMALQQQENIKAFEERNRRFGSDRKSSRSTAYCSPGYRPRLLNDNTPVLMDGDRADGGEQNLGTHARKKRPAMSDSHFFSHNNLVSLDHCNNNNNNNNNCDSSKGEDTMKPNTLQSDNVSSTEIGTVAAVLPPKPMSQQDIMDHRMAVALQEQEDNALSHRFTATGNVSRKPSRSNARTQVQRAGIGNVFGGVESIVPASLMTWTRGGDIVAENDGPTTASVSSMEPNDGNNNNNINNENNGNIIMDMNMGATLHRDSNGFDMDRKPAATCQGGNIKQEIDGLDHHHDFSCSSFSSRGRVQFKDDSDMMSLFGEGDTIIPPPTTCTNSTGSFNRVRNTFSTNNSSTCNKTSNNDDNRHFNPIALNEKNQIHHSHHHHHHQQGDSNRDLNSNPNNNRIHQHRQQQHNNNRIEHRQLQQQQQDSSLLSQVATHILGTLGGGSSWTDSDTGPGPSKQVATTLHQASFSNNHLHQQERNNHRHSPETEMELGQEVIMDVRDESSMPPPQPRGSGVQIDWPSRAGCHTWIPDTISASCPAILGQNNVIEHDHQDMSHANDHSLSRQNIYGRSDISPINSMDMDFSHSSYAGDQRRRNHGGANSSLLHVFDQKNDNSNPEGISPHIHRSVLQQIPSWDRSFRSRSPISLGDLSVGGNEMDNSLIRVHSHDVMKEKRFGVGQPSSSGHDLQQRCQQPLQHHSPLDQAQTKPPPTYHHSHRHQHQHQRQHTLSSSHPQNYHESRDMDWEEHAGE
mmetsp:Transcript_193/g.192  ORF Transcript_193/g.192 Transcript_193/m.192 type:complete len:1154 (+) Transcript_193:587-4048(+)